MANDVFSHQHPPPHIWTPAWVLYHSQTGVYVRCVAQAIIQSSGG